MQQERHQKPMRQKGRHSRRSRYRSESDCDQLLPATEIRALVRRALEMKGTPSQRAMRPTAAKSFAWLHWVVQALTVRLGLLPPAR
jgi:hypothetical protein